MASDPKNTDVGKVVNITAAGLGTVTTNDLQNVNATGLTVVVDITAITGTSPTLTVTIQGKDVASGKYYTILAGAALTATGTTVMRIYPGITQTNTATLASFTIPEWYRISYTIGGTTPAVTATIGVCTQL